MAPINSAVLCIYHGNARIFHFNAPAWIRFEAPKSGLKLREMSSHLLNTAIGSFLPTPAGMLNNPLTSPFELNPCANRIFQSFR
jgi:hypothetical protein